MPGALREQANGKRGIHLAQSARGTPNRWRHANQRCLPCTRRRQVGAVDQDDIDGWRILETRHPVLLHRPVADASVAEIDRLEEGATEPLDDRSLDLIAET